MHLAILMHSKLIIVGVSRGARLCQGGRTPPLPPLNEPLPRCPSFEKTHIIILTATSFLDTVSLRLEIIIDVAVVIPLCLAPPPEEGKGAGGATL